MIATMTVVDGCGDDFDTEHADYECHDDPKRLEGMKMMR